MENQYDFNVGKDINEIEWKSSDLYLKASCEVLYSVKEDKKNEQVWNFRSRKRAKITHSVLKCNKMVQDKFENGQIELTRQIYYNVTDYSSFHIKLKIKNICQNEIKLNNMIPLKVEGMENLRISGSEADKWWYFRQGRHKNDLPSTSIPGKKDEAYKDCFVGLSESGTKTDTEKELPPNLKSDELTVLRGNMHRNSQCLLIGFVSAKSHLVRNEIELDNENSHFRRMEVSCLFDGVTLYPGDERESEWLRVCGSNDAFDAIFEYAKIRSKLLSRKSLFSKPPSVYCTWYYYANTITHDDVMINLHMMSKLKIPVEVFQIDDGWSERRGVWEPNHKFAFGMKYIAEKIRSYGYIPGIWTCPFITEVQSGIRRTRPEWILKKRNGDYVLFYLNGQNYFVLDVTHPEVLEYIENLYRKLTFEWGYRYHKLDFTRAVALDPDAVFYDNSKNRAQAYRTGLETVRKGAGDNAYILVCGGLYGPSAGIADAQRTGSDIKSAWTIIKNGKEVKFAPFTIKQNVLRYWMNDLWHNDPDALTIRKRNRPFRGIELSLGFLNDEEAKVVAINQYLGGGLICFTENIDEISKERLGLLRHIIPSIGKAAVPRDMITGERYQSIFDVEVEPENGLPGKWHTVSIINWSDSPQTRSVKLNENLTGKYVEKNELYIISEFFSGKIWNNVAYGDDITIEIAPHSAVHLRVIKEKTDQSLLVYTNGHFSMGATEIKQWKYDGNSLYMSIEWPWDYEMEMIIRAPFDREWDTENMKKGKAVYINKINSKDLKIIIKERYIGSLKILLK